MKNTPDRVRFDLLPVALFWAAVGIVCLIALFSSGCASIENQVRKAPGFEFKSWSHADRYGVFTDTITASGAKWTLNADGSATLTLEHWDGSAAWAGSVGPHDVIENLVITFPPESPQAVSLRRVVAAGAGGAR